MGNDVSAEVPEVNYLWTLRAKNQFRDTTPIVSGDGSTVALYSRGEHKVHVVDGSTGAPVAVIKCAQKDAMGNVAAIPSLSRDGSKIVFRDGHTVFCYDRTGNRLWAHTRDDKKYRSGMQSWVAQICASGRVVVVRMFHHMILLNGETGGVIESFHHRSQMAPSIPRISADGSVVVNVDGRYMLGYVNAKLAWSVESPERSAALYDGRLADPALSADGSTCAVVAGDTAYIYDARAGQRLGSIGRVRNWHHENSCEVALSYDGSIAAVVRHKLGISVHTGPGYGVVLMEYFSAGPHRPVAPLLTPDGRTLASKCGTTILVWGVPTEGGGGGSGGGGGGSGGARGHFPRVVARVADDSGIPGGPTVHNQYAHHDRDTQHKRTFSCSDDGTLCVAVAKFKELWAFSLNEGAPQGGTIR